MGGKAFAGTTQRILTQDIPETLDWLTKNWAGSKIQGGDFNEHLLGSAGKNDDSGDLDLNLRIELYDQAEVAAQLTELLGEDAVMARPGNNQIFTAVPIKGDASNGMVQVDFMFGDYRWQHFSYHSPARHDYVRWGNNTASGFKGLYRTEFLKALTTFNSSWVLKEGDEIIARTGPTFFHDKGVVWRHRYRPMRQDGTARVQAFKEVTKAEFLELFPSAITSEREPILDPADFMGFIFEAHSKPKDANTLEHLAYLFRRYYNSEQRTTVEKIYSERLNNLKVDLRTADMRNIYLTVK